MTSKFSINFEVISFNFISYPAIDYFINSATTKQLYKSSID